MKLSKKIFLTNHHLYALLLCRLSLIFLLWGSENHNLHSSVHHLLRIIQNLLVTMCMALGIYSICHLVNNIVRKKSNWGECTFGRITFVTYSPLQFACSQLPIYVPFCKAMSSKIKMGDTRKIIYGIAWSSSTSTSLSSRE